MVDYDLDGNIDIIHADDQGAFPRARDGGLIALCFIFCTTTAPDTSQTKRWQPAPNRRSVGWLGLRDFNAMAN